MRYYSSNAIYEKLASEKKKNFHWVSENAWILVYGDNKYILRVIVLAFNNQCSRDPEIVKQTCKIAKDAKLPMIQICFDSSKKIIDSVDVSKFDNEFTSMKLIDLTSLFSQFGLPVLSGVTSKAINSAESSAYHNWQRNNLGGRVVVADVDLIKVQKDGIANILELKRSFYDLESWSPYRADFSNFYVLENLCHLSNNKFFIVYNKRVTKPNFIDDASKVSIFSFNQGKPKKIGIFDFDQLFS